MATIIVGVSDTLTTNPLTPYFTSGNIYEFVHDHDLADEVLEFPADVILRFNGGSLDKGTLKGNNTVIDAPMTVIFGKELLIDPTGTWKIDQAHSDWFDCYKNGYYIDPLTFIYVSTTYQYEYNSTTFDQGDLCGATYNNDRPILQQLLNLNANHTIISEGIYMVDSAGGTGEDTDNQLTWFQKEGLTLQIDGILKMIPNSFTNSNVLLIAECKGVKLCGTGKLVGDLFEHQGTAGEGGMCLQVNSTYDLQTADLTFEQGWGDGVYCSWRRYSSGTDTNVQHKHSWMNIKCLYNRRTGFVYEKGDDVVVSESVFANNGMYIGSIYGTFSGVDIEPFEDNYASKRYCQNFTFRNCIFERNLKGGLRAQRCVGLIVDANRFEQNNTDILLLHCNFSSYDIVPGVFTDRQFEAGCVNVVNNQSRNSVTFIDCEENPSRAIIENNYMQNTGTPFAGMWVDTIFRGNKVYNSSNVMRCHAVLKNVTVESNEYHHVSLVYGEDNLNETPIISLPYYDPGSTHLDFYDFQLTNFVFQNNLIKDYSLKQLNGSGDPGTDWTGNQPLPNSKLRYFLIRMNSNLITDRAVFKDNIFPRERFTYPFLINPLSGGMEKIHFYNKIDPKTDKFWVAGDYFYDEEFAQEAVVVQAGRTGVYSEWVTFTGSGIAIPAHTILFEPYYNSGRPVNSDRVTGGSVDATAPDAIPFNMNLPVVHWKTIGRCESTGRPTDYNSVGRTLIETDTADMIKYNSITPAWDVL